MSGRFLGVAALLALTGCSSGGTGAARGADGGAAGSSAGGTTTSSAGASSGGVTTGGTGGDGNGGIAPSGGAPAGTGGSAGTPVATGGASTMGGSTGAGGTAPEPAPDAGSEVTLGELPVQLARASCGALEQCLGAASASFFDGGSCKASLEPATVEGTASTFAALAAKGTLTYDPTKVAACLASIRASGCDYPDRRLAALCPDVVVGKVVPGAACTVNAECGVSAYCKTTTCPGTCTKLVAKGAGCIADDDCVDGLVCDGTARECLAPGKKGDACSDTAPCGAAFVCDGTAHCVEFSGIFTATSGKTCDPQGQALCESTLTCALVSIDAQQKGVWNCEKPVTTGACHVALPEQCAAGSYCELGGALSGTCKAAPAASAPCASRLPSDTTVAKDICAPGLTCWADGTCHSHAHLTEPCTADDNCYSGTCRNKVCVATHCAP